MDTVTIAGSGISGLTAAIVLAKAGKKVEVFERNKDAGQRFFGDLQGLENWSGALDALDEVRRHGLIVNFDADPFNDLTVSNGTATFEVKHSKRPLFYLVKRGTIEGSIDQGLKRQALDAGVTIRYGESIEPEKADIIATGPIHDHIVAVAKGFVFRTSHPDIAHGIINDDVAYGGYAYLLVTKGYGCLCTVLFDRFRDLPRELAAARTMFARLLPMDMADEKPVGGIGCFTHKNRWVQEGRRYVGEAAGMQDYLWGFGMRNSMMTGWLAAKSIIENSDYVKDAEAFFRPRLNAGIVNRWLWQRFGRANYITVLNRLKASADPVGLLRSFYNFNPLQRLLYPWAFRRIRQRYPKLLE